MAFVLHVPTVMPCQVECVVTYFNEAYSHAHCILKNFFLWHTQNNISENIQVSIVVFK